MEGLDTMEGSYSDSEQLLEHVLVHLIGHHTNDTRGVAEWAHHAHLRRSLQPAWLAWVALYAVLVVGGAFANGWVLQALARRSRRVDDNTRALVANLAVANLVQCLVVVPASLSVMLLQNWVFGRALCYCLPMIQDIPLHVTMMTFLLMATDRYRMVLYPYKPRIPVCICALGTWMLAVCIVVPYPFYITYLDLEVLRDQLRGIGVCMVNLPESMEDYMRGLFVLAYVLPLLCMVYLFVRVRVEMNVRGPPLAAMMFRARTTDHPDSPSVVFREEPRGLYEAQLDFEDEKRVHMNFVSMVVTYALLLCPLMVLRLVNQMVAETYENGAAYDVIYTVFVWFAFLHTFTTPFYFYVWHDGPVTKEQLKAFLCPGSQRRLRRRSERALEAVVLQQQRALPRRPQSLPLALEAQPLPLPAADAAADDAADSVAAA